MALETIKVVVWLRGLVSEVGFKQDNVVLHCDSRVQFTWRRIKYIKYIAQEQIILTCNITRLEKGFLGDISLSKVHTNGNVFDMLTTPVPRNKFKICLYLISI